MTEHTEHPPHPVTGHPAHPVTGHPAHPVTGLPAHPVTGHPRRPLTGHPRLTGRPRRPLTGHLRHYASALLLPLVALTAVTYGAGELVTSLPTGEAAVNTGLAAWRSGLWNTLTDIGTSLSDTPYIVALTAATAAFLGLVRRRLHEAAFLVAAVWSQSLIFLATSALVARHRPPVHHLDPAPPTSSFPSGHVSAAVGFYCAVALLLAVRVRGPVARALVWTLGVAVPLVVAFSRLYRGMHFLTDVLWGLLLGACCVAVSARAILARRAERRAWRCPPRGGGVGAPGAAR
ncbi:phosphatase PAP2 family protein [Nonomuraea sp. NPDC047897]|uniref:phosphatase PAP2 family protein n=1 Tax=Nonomuraea sp. NPDC047897 TaxID=3364346 RepID=UPI0037214F3F